MSNKENTTIVLIEDNLPEDDPLIIELSMLFNSVKLFKHSKDGLDYVTNNLSTKMIVVLDIQFSKDELNGHDVLKHIREESKLIPVIIWSANGFSEGEDLTDFINNQAMFYLTKTTKLEIMIQKIQEANRLLKLDVATAIEEWLELQDEKEQTMIFHGNGNQYSAIDLIKEIRTQTTVGQQMEENMLKLTIDLLFRDKEQLG